MSYESVNKIKSLQQHIETFTGKSYSDLTAAVQELKNGYGSSGGGSGIIEVPELPTENIDESAVYRVIESEVIEDTQVYLYYFGTAMTLQQFLEWYKSVRATVNIYVVDELSNMLETDGVTMSVVNAYVLESSGVAYVNIPDSGGIVSLGQLVLGSTAYDRGWAETKDHMSSTGMYSVPPVCFEIEKYFVRENGEWRELTAYVYTLDNTQLEYVSGNLTKMMFSASEILSGECTEIDENWFIKRNGEYVTMLKRYIFSETYLRKATIPQFIESVQDYVFYSCYDLETVTFKGTPKINPYALSECPNLTTINVPWSEGEVANAPFGAYNATINYNYTGE